MIELLNNVLKKVNWNKRVEIMLDLSGACEDSACKRYFADLVIASILN